MTISQLITLLGYMTVCSFTPGPGNLLALGTTSQYGWQKSRVLIFGICTGYAAVQAICTVCVLALNQTLTAALDILKYAGGLYMVWLAIHMMRSRPGRTSAETLPTFRQGFLLQLVNVKIYFYIITLLSVYFIPYASSGWGLVFDGIGAVALGSAATFAWAFLGIKLQAVYEKHYQVIHIILGAFLLYCAWSIVKG